MQCDRWWCGFVRLKTTYGGERLNVGYVMVLIIDVIEPHLIVEDVHEGDLWCYVFDDNVTLLDIKLPYEF